MSPLEYFAAHAPEAVPPWYKPPPPTRPRPKLPKPEDWPASVQRIIIEWLHDGCFDLPAEAASFADAHRAAVEAIEAWQTERSAQIFFAWRWYYAARMVASGTIMKRGPTELK